MPVIMLVGAKAKHLFVFLVRPVVSIKPVSSVECGFAEGSNFHSVKL